MKIERYSVTVGPLTLSDNPNASTKIAYAWQAGGLLICGMNVGPGTVTITWHAANGPNDTPVPVYDAGNAVQTVIEANRAYPIPDALFGAPYIVAVSDIDGVNPVTFCLKG